MKTAVGLALVVGALAAETQSYWGDAPIDSATTTTTTSAEATWSDYDPAESTTATTSSWADYDPSKTTTPVEETETETYWSGKCRAATLRYLR